ncbi:hypothetical protein FD755_024721 [Muntiacus reevesi]|uniref:PX domain-containing protein n=1 Tax=Muntiacus reevesi TaxID=9886 RepID=A0A5N3UUY5_MUNRE|nr:hypothetical protein FD755_024721 [Muntiacus reevesi]
MASAVFEGTSLVNMFVRGCWVNGIRRLVVSRRGDEEEFFEIRTEWSDRSVLYLHRSLADLGRLWQRLRDAFPEDRPELARAPLRQELARVCPPLIPSCPPGPLGLTVRGAHSVVLRAGSSPYSLYFQADLLFAEKDGLDGQTIHAKGIQKCVFRLPGARQLVGAEDAAENKTDNPLPSWFCREALAGDGELGAEGLDGWAVWLLC